MMADLTVRQILDAFERGLEETRRKIERGEMRQDGRLDSPVYVGAEEEVARMEKRPGDQRHDAATNSGCN
jgi:hypothetical protein